MLIGTFRYHYKTCWSKADIKEVIMIAGWTIWCHKNVIILDGASISLDRWKEAFKDEVSLGLDFRPRHSLKSGWVDYEIIPFFSLGPTTLPLL
jgi:hypothetical protein